MGADRGWKVPGYTLEHVLGYGATGEVWRARVARSGEPVAIKRVPVADAAVARAARAEAALLSALDHPNLLRLREFVPQETAMALVLDLAGGGSLADLLHRRGRLAPGEVVTALAPVAAALAYAHDEGVTHCDVSAGNVLFTDEGRPLLADLGVARLLGDVAAAHATPAYLDPAVAAGSAPGPPSDVFSLAAVALHALTGCPPWGGRTVEQTVALAETGEIPGLDDRLHGLNPTLADLLRRALAVEPSARGSAAEFALDLRHTVEPVPVELSAGRPGPGAGPASVAPGRIASAASGAVAPLAPVASERASVFRPRHAAPDLELSATARPESETTPESERGPVSGPGLESGAGRIPFDRPGWRGVDSPDLPVDGGSGAAAVLTHAVRGRVRAQLLSEAAAPRPRWARWARPALVGRRTAVAAAALALLVAGIGGGGWWWLRRPPGPGSVRSLIGTPAGSVPSAPPPAPKTAAPFQTAAPSRTPPPRPGVPRPAPRQRTVAGASDWSDVLRRLDDRRADAFAQRDAGRLAQVYVKGTLLNQDVASLTRSVPSGCGLSGLRTTYRAVVASGPPDRSVRVVATATLGAATLRCAGRTVSRGAPQGPARMTLLLVRQGPEYRISRLELSG